MEKELYADVILPIAVSSTFTYLVPEQLAGHVKTGQRVVVQFGKRKLYTALVYKVHTNRPELYKAKKIESLLDAAPIVNEKQLMHWKWISDYYMCTMGEVMNAALPSGLKLASETKLILSTHVKEEELSDDEFLIYDALKKNNILTLDETEKILHEKSPYRVIGSMLEKKAIRVYEELKEKFKPKVTEFIKLTSLADTENELKKIFKSLEKKAFKQLEVLMAFIQLSDRYSKSKKEVKKSELLKSTRAAANVIQALVDKEIFEVYEKETGRFAAQDATLLNKDLSEEQNEALTKIKNEWKEKEVVLLHGVTSSGKTEIYVRLIKETIEKGKQVLYLLPEIALTTQVISRIKKYFGDTIGVYHSRFNENERVEIWNEVNKFQFKSSKFNVILGARSSLFLPFSAIGLILVDEEYDSSYKQFDPAPRYHARDAAIMLAHLHQAKVLLGSATPSVESYFNAHNNKYGYVDLITRYGGIQMPEILVADIKEDTKRKKMKSIFSPLLMENIQLALENKEQVILFQNRRGFAPMLECKTCGWTPVCKNCDVSLVYHKTGAQLRCHYCGYMTPVPSSCAACGNTALQMKSFGTEKIEEELQLFFPDARISRMDYDSTRSRFAHEQLITDFEEKNIDILVGTQMVTKGLDFEHVSTVGILNADQMMNFPDFRSHEKSFQLMAQVAGRSGRKNKRGKVIIQTYSPQHPIIQHVIHNDFEKMYDEEIEHRKNFHYPPFHRLIEITLLNKDISKVETASAELGNKLKAAFGKRVLGPEFPMIPRIKNLYHKKILIKIAKDESANVVKEKIRSVIESFHEHPSFKSGKIIFNVDPA